MDDVARPPARRCRQKRLSHEGESQNDVFPTLSNSAGFVNEHRAPLLATFVLAWVWFGQIVAPLVPQATPSTPSTPSTTMMARKTPMDKLGLAFATNSPSMMYFDLAAHQHKRERAVRPPPAAKAGTPWSKNDLGLYFATGATSLIHLTENPTTATRAPPATATSPPRGARGPASDVDMRSFVAVCVLVHTLIVGFGLAFGSDSTDIDSSRGPASALLAAGGASFVFVCFVLYVSWEYNVGPVPAVAAKIFAQSEAAFVLVGAASATMWLSVSMLLEATGAAASPTLCGLTALAGGIVLATDASVGVSLSCLVVLVGGLVGSALFYAAQARNSGRRSSMEALKAWNL